MIQQTMSAFREWIEATPTSFETLQHMYEKGDDGIELVSPVRIQKGRMSNRYHHASGCPDDDSWRQDETGQVVLVRIFVR